MANTNPRPRPGAPTGTRLEVIYRWELESSIVVRVPGGKSIEIVRIFAMCNLEEGDAAEDTWIITTCQGYPLTARGERDGRSDGNTSFTGVPDSITDPYEDKARQLLAAQLKVVQ